MAGPITLYDRVKKRAAALKSERTGQGWDSHWRDIADHMRPRRSRFLTTDTNKGTKVNNSIIDSTGVRASTVLTSGMMNGMSNPSQQWFRYEPDDLELLEYGPAKDWIGKLEKLARRILHASNAYEALPLIYDELGLFGTGCSVIEDDYEDVIRLNTFTVGEYCLALNKRRRVDTLYREMRMSVIQCVQSFVARKDGSLDWSKVSTYVKTQYDTGNYDAWVDVWHCIEPNPDADTDKLDTPNMAFRSLYWDAKDDRQKRFLKQGGFRENPIMAPRWSVVGNDVYGRSPGMDALGDVRQLQIQHKRLGEAIDKLVNPPTQGPPALADRFISRLPGAHTTVSDLSQGGVRPIYEVKPEIGPMLQAIEDTRGRVEETFFVRDLLAISRMDGVQPKNQMEIAERKGEGLMVLGPVVERSQNELLSPLHNRIINRIIEVSLPFWAVGEAGMIPPPPPELQGVPLQIQYQSALAVVQKQSAVQGLERVANMALGLVQAFPEAVARKFDPEQFLDEYNDAVNGASRIIRADDIVAAIAQEQAQQQQIQQLAALAAPAKDAAQAVEALGNAKVASGPEEGTGALEAMLRQGAEAAA